MAELVAPFEMTPRAVSKRVGVLEAAGLVARTRDAQRRPSRIRAEPLAAIDAWLDQYRTVWAARFDKLKRHLAQPKGTKDER